MSHLSQLPWLTWRGTKATIQNLSIVTFKVQVVADTILTMVGSIITGMHPCVYNLMDFVRNMVVNTMVPKYLYEKT